MLPDPAAGSVEPRVPGCVEPVVIVVPGRVNAVVVSAFVAVMAVDVAAVVVVGGVSPGAAMPVEVPLAEPSFTTSYCCCSRCRFLSRSLQPAAKTQATTRNPTVMIFMTFCAFSIRT